MKTIAQIAKEIGVSKQAVHSRIKKEPLKSALIDKSETIGNALHINVDGEMLIKSAFRRMDVDEVLGEMSKAGDEIVKNSTTELIESLREQNRFLQAQNEDLRQQLNEERTHSRKQADEILQLAQQGQKIAENAQKLHAMENMPKLTDGKKKGFISRLFSRSGSHV